ncbi:hypothetical protein ACFYRJ_17660 [Streptomyces sp. NPDC005531]|uniref:hypothetical protein n=1 Tax=Streptomyces sp. NPDC005531 TaxID=3364722 RepID=UPI0036AA66F2
MSSYNATFFLSPQAQARGDVAVHPVLYVEPDGRYGAGHIVLQMPSELTQEERVKIAEQFLEGVTKWRDEIVGYANQQRTATDELAAAREEIARLKAEAGESE